MATERQTNFLGGELSQYLWGRTDLPIFQIGLRKCRNFFASKAGALVSRPGTKCVLRPDNGDPNLANRPVFTKYYANPNKAIRGVRLLPFIFSDTDSLVLEFGFQYVRFISNGVQVESSPGVPLEGVTPYTCADLAQLQWAQSGDVLTITHPLYEPRQLKRFGPLSWTFNIIEYQRPAPIFRDLLVNVDTDNPVLVGATAGDANHPAKPWVWQVTALLEEVGIDPNTLLPAPTGRVFESMPFTVSVDDVGAPLIDKIAVHSDLAVTVRRTAGGPITPAYKVVGYLVYRGQGTVMGFVGVQDKGDSLGRYDFVDVGDEPDYAVQPPQGTHPFKVFNPDLTLNRTECPLAVAYFQDRFCFGGTTQRPGAIFTSATGDYSNFDLHQVIHVSGEALYFELATRRREEIRSLLPLSKLLVFTQSSVWSMAGANGPLDFDSVDARAELAIGATFQPALAIGAAAIFCRAKGSGVHTVTPSHARVGLDGSDLSLVAQHLFQGRSVTAWCYAEDPWGVVWVVRDDGKLVSLTYNPDTGAAAWALHDSDSDTDVDTGFGFFQAITSVPEANQDAVYVVRGIENSGGLGGTIERFCSRQRLGSATGADDDNVAVESAITLTIPITQLAIPFLSHLEGHKVYVVGPGNPVQGPLTVTGGGVNLPIPAIANTLVGGVASARLHVGRKFTPQVETLDWAPPNARTAQKTVTEMGFEVDETRGVSVGPDFEHLDEVQERDVDDDYGATQPETRQQLKYIGGGFNSTGRAVLRQAQPLAVTIVGLTRELDVGGK